MSKSQKKSAVDDVPLIQRLGIDEARLRTGQGIDNVDPFLANWYGLLGHPIKHYVEGGIYLDYKDQPKSGHSRFTFQPDSSHVTEWRRNESTDFWEGKPRTVQPGNSLYLGSAKNRVFFSRSQINTSDRPLEISGFPELPYEDGFLVLPINRCPLHTANEAGFTQYPHRLMVMTEFVRDVKVDDKERQWVVDRQRGPVSKRLCDLGYQQWVKVSVAFDRQDEKESQHLVHTQLVAQRPNDRFFLEDRTARFYFR